MSIRLTSIPAQPGFIHLKQAAPESAALTSALIDAMPPEEMRRVIKLILGCQGGDQPHRGIDTHPLPFDGDFSITDPSDFEGLQFCRLGQRSPQRGSQQLAGRSTASQPQRQQLRTVTAVWPARRTGQVVGQIQVSPIGSAGKSDIAGLEVNVELDVEGRPADE